MTETAGSPAAAPGRGRKAGRTGERRGLTVERVYTTPGVHPYDEVTWQRRDVVMTNWRDGTVNFEQRGVEFPEFWSVNATNIVTSKYFRGAVGSPQRESSLRQLIDRVVGVYHRAGLEHGYFATENDAEIFAHELTWMLLHQVFSFNSPVWFNVGTTSPAAGLGVLHPLRGRHDGIHSQLVPGRGSDLQGRFRCGAEPVADPVLEGAAVLRRHGLRPGVVHARRRRQRRHHQVRWRHPARGEDGRPRRRPPGHRGVRPDQGQGGGQDPGAARRRVRHGPRRLGHHLGAVPEREQLGARHRRVHARGRVGRRVRAAGPHDRRGHRHRRRQEAVPGHRAGGVGLRGPGHPVRRHDQRLAHLPGVGAHLRVQSLQRVHAPRQLQLQPRVAQPPDVPRRRREVRRRPVPEGRRADHHGDGHLDLLRRLPDGADRRHHPPVPPAGHRLRQPRRPADGHRARLRLRGRPLAGRGDHLADDRCRLQALGRARRGRRAVRRLRPQRRVAPAGDAQARRGERRRAHVPRERRDPPARDRQPGARRSPSAPSTAGATRRPRCSPRPAPSA